MRRGARIARRDFVVGSMAAASVAGAAALIPACSKLTGGSIVPGNGGYVLNVRYGKNTIGGKTFHTRTYNGTVPGPILETRPGDTLSVTVVNNLPPNAAATLPPSGTHVVPKFASMEQAMRGRAVGTQTAVGAVDPMNNPHEFNTTNLHVHGIQTITHLYEPIGTSNPSAEISRFSREIRTRITFQFQTTTQADSFGFIRTTTVRPTYKLPAVWRG